MCTAPQKSSGAHSPLNDECSAAVCRFWAVEEAGTAALQELASDGAPAQELVPDGAPVQVRAPLAWVPELAWVLQAAVLAQASQSSAWG